MAGIEDLVKLVRSANTRSEIKTAVQRCLALTTSLRSDRLQQRSGVWFPIGEALVHALNPSFVGVFPKREYEELFVETFVQAPAIDSISLLVHSLKTGFGNKSDNAYVLEKILHVLDVVVRKNLARLLVDLSTPVSTATSAIDGNESTSRLIQDLVSIPDRAAAVVRGGRVDECSVLNVGSYCRTVALAMVEALRHLRDVLSTGTGDCCLKFLSDLLGKFYLSGYGRQIMQILAPCLYGHCCGGRESMEDYIWRRMSKRLFTGVHTLALDGVVVDLVITLSSRDSQKIVDLEKLLGESVEKEEKIKYVLTNKLLLTRHFDETVLVPETILRYLLNTMERRRTILRPTLVKLLTIWSSATSVTRSSFEKHYYISRSIIIACGRLTEEERRDIQNEITPLILRGVSTHLHAVDENVRKVGMVVGELLTNLFVAGKDKEKLKFEYEDDERTKYLKSLTEARHDDEFVSVAELMEPEAEIPSAVSEERNGAEYKVVTGFDSDDDEDLIPYDLPNETEGDTSAGHAKEALPVYIRDCLDCVVERKSFFLCETALRSLEQLIRRNSPGADDLAVEVAQVLLHAEDHYALANEFSSLQRSIMTASCVKQPKLVATFLTSQFYEKNYSIQHRLLILDVLVSAAKELSKPNAEERDEEKADVITVATRKAEPAAPTPSIPTWRQVVQTRVEKRTRRWGSAVTGQRPKVHQPAMPNRFAPLAGPCFFYPLLLEMDKRIETLDMFGADYIVLGRLLFATGTILYEAENAPGLTSMAIVQVHVVLHRTSRHEQPFVRQGSLFALIMAFMAVPSRILAVECQDELLEAQSWLERTRSDDPDEQCRQLADQALRLVAKKANEGLNALIEVGLPK